MQSSWNEHISLLFLIIENQDLCIIAQPRVWFLNTPVLLSLSSVSRPLCLMGRGEAFPLLTIEGSAINNIYENGDLSECVWRPCETCRQLTGLSFFCALAPSESKTSAQTFPFTPVVASSSKHKQMKEPKPQVLDSWLH